MSGWERMEEATDYADRLLVGERVVLRALREEDLPLLEGWWQRLETMPLQRDAVLPQPAGSAAASFRSWSANEAPASVGFSVVERTEGQLVGHVTLHGASVRNRCATLAVMIGAEHLGRGHGSDAVAVLVRYGFAELGLHRIELATMAFNTRGLSVYRRAGFVEEGRRREVAFHDGRFHDEILMSVLDHEWAARSAE